MTTTDPTATEQPPADGCTAAWTAVVDCPDSPDWGTHVCDEDLDHGGNHVCTCGQHIPQCRTQYAPGRSERGARIVACSLARGHNGDHEELATESAWPADLTTAGQPHPDASANARADAEKLRTVGQWAATTDPTAPRTPSEELRQAADMVEAGMPLATAGRLRRWAAELDAAPAATATAPPEHAPGVDPDWCGYLAGKAAEALRQLGHEGLADHVEHLERAHAAGNPQHLYGSAAPAVYALPAEPPDTVTELWEVSTGRRWERQQPYGWCRDGRHDDATWCRWPWFGLLDERGPLSTTPPARTWTCPVPGHADVERDDDEARCLAPGCARSSSDPPGGRRSCECELYDCTGGCCGPGQCSCSAPERDKLRIKVQRGGTIQQLTLEATEGDHHA